jgi:alpha-amylase
MPSVCFYFQVHQPFRIKRYRIFDVGRDSDYFNGSDRLDNAKILEKVARKCYLPANAILLDCLRQHPDLRISFSFSGTLLAQLTRFCPEALQSFQKLADTGQVEILGETDHHSLACLYSMDEFKRQVRLHAKTIQSLFGQRPRVFRNTELIYNNLLAQTVAEMGYRGILAEGADRILGWRSPNFVYTPTGTQKMGLLLKNYRLSDDIAFRFSNRGWEGYPLMAGTFADWITDSHGAVVNLFMDYETFGEHQWAETGIFEFLRALPGEILKRPGNDFVTPSEALSRYEAVGEMDIPDFISWADVERDLSAWIGNPMQQEALQKLYDLGTAVLKKRDPVLTADWRALQTSDHFYYMCTKWFADGDVHRYFNPYESPYEAFIGFMNVLKDVAQRAAPRPRKKRQVSEA